MIKPIKIATILPYKENYTFSKAQAAAIWVCDFFKYSKFKENNFIYGNTKSRDYLTKNYINIEIVKNIATQEHYSLFKKYQLDRHPGGSMSNMSEDDFISMIETSSVETYLMEFRDNSKKLLGVMLFDEQNNALSAVYSFFDPDLSKFGIGNFMIIKCLMYGMENNYKYLYLGYYIKEVSSMAYKIRFKPGQILEDGLWNNI